MKRFHIVHAGKTLSIRQIGPQEYDVDCLTKAWETVWFDYFDLSTSYQAIRERITQAQDPYLYDAMTQQKGIRILKQDPWETLICFILSQNRNIPAITSSISNLCTQFGQKRKGRDGDMYHVFPNPHKLIRATTADLQSCGLGYRTPYVHHAAKMVASGDVDLNAWQDLDDETLYKELLKLYGVGAKVAQCVMLFGFHRLNAFPVDVWVKRILEKYEPQGYPMEQYAPYNGVYQQYLFAYERARGTFINEE